MSRPYKLDHAKKVPRNVLVMTTKKEKSIANIRPDQKKGFPSV